HVSNPGGIRASAHSAHLSCTPVRNTCRNRMHCCPIVVLQRSSWLSPLPTANAKASDAYRIWCPILSHISQTLWSFAMSRSLATWWLMGVSFRERDFADGRFAQTVETVDKDAC